MSEVSKITEHIYLGNRNHAKQKALLKRLKIKSILRTAVGCEDFFIKDNGYDYLSFDLYDDDREYLLPVLSECFKFIDAKTNAGQNLLVHCHLGKSRSASIVIAYFMLKTQYSFKDAYKYIKSKRSIVKPNKGFQVQLMILEQVLESYRESCDSIFEEDFDYLDLLLKTFKLDTVELKEQAVSIKENIYSNQLKNYKNHQKEFEELQSLHAKPRTFSIESSISLDTSTSTIESEEVVFQKQPTTIVSCQTQIKE